MSKLTGLLFWVSLTLIVTACGVAQQSWSGVTQADNAIYVSNGRFIAKLDANGERLWTYPDEDDRNADFFADVTVADEAVYVGDYKGMVHAIEAATGERLWLYEGTKKATRLLGLVNFGGSTDRVLAPITVVEDVLYVPHETGVFLLDRATGEPIEEGELETDRSVWAQPLYVPAAEDQPARVYVTALNHRLYAVDPTTYENLWNVDLGGAAPGGATYDPENQVLYVGTLGNEMLAVDALTGNIITRYETNDWVWGNPVLADGTLYFGDLDAYLYALTYSDGRFEERWVEELDGSKIRATPLVADDLLVVSTEAGSVYGIQRDSGAEEWREELERPILSTLIQVEATTEGESEQVVVVSTDNTEELLVALRLDNGNRRWSYRHED